MSTGRGQISRFTPHPGVVTVGTTLPNPQCRVDLDFSLSVSDPLGPVPTPREVRLPFGPVSGSSEYSNPRKSVESHSRTYTLLRRLDPQTSRLPRPPDDVRGDRVSRADVGTPTSFRDRDTDRELSRRHRWVRRPQWVQRVRLSAGAPERRPPNLYRSPGRTPGRFSTAGPLPEPCPKGEM